MLAEAAKVISRVDNEAGGSKGLFIRVNTRTQMLFAYAAGIDTTLDSPWLNSVIARSTSALSDYTIGSVAQSTGAIKM